MARLALAAMLVALAGGVASAGPTRKVSIDTQPPGATIYLDEVANGPVCDSTPCTFNSPLGTHTLIVRLAQYEPEFSTIEVPKGKKPLEHRVKLKSALGTIIVNEPKNASVRVDEEDKGKTPAQISVASGEGHHVVVTLGGKTYFDDIVELATGDETVIKPSQTKTQATPQKIEEEEEGGGGGGGSGSQEISGSAPGPDKGTVLAAAVAIDIGFRSFTYSDAPANPGGVPLKPETESNAIVGPAIEFWPGRLAGSHFFRGTSFFGRYQWSPVGQNVTSTGNPPLLMGPVKTMWTSFEGSLRQRWMFSEVGVEASVGYVQDNFKFSGGTTDLEKLPDTEYPSVRIGARVLYDAGAFKPYAAAEARIVIGGGPFKQRFASAEAFGVRAALGTHIALMSWLSARIEGALLNYSWQLRYEDTMSKFQAKGATDSIKYISALAVFTF